MALPVGFDPATGRFTGVYSPRVQSSHNNYGNAFSLDTDGEGFTRPARRENLWARINYAIKVAGNWIDDIIDPVSSWVSLICMIIGGIALLIWVFSDSNIIYIILRFFGACIIGYIGLIGIGIMSWLLQLVLKIVRFIFWNAYTLIIAIVLLGAVWIAGMVSPDWHSSSANTEVVVPVTETYECTAYVLNIRTAPNTVSNVLGTFKQGDKIEVIEIKDGFGRINYNGNTGYVSLKYLKKLQE